MTEEETILSPETLPVIDLSEKEEKKPFKLPKIECKQSDSGRTP